MSARGRRNPLHRIDSDQRHRLHLPGPGERGREGPSNEATATPMDTTAPMLTGATTTALALELFYDEDLDAGSEPAPSAFTVTVDGASRAVTAVSVDGTKVP